MKPATLFDLVADDDFAYLFVVVVTPQYTALRAQLAAVDGARRTSTGVVLPNGSIVVAISPESPIMTIDGMIVHVAIIDGECGPLRDVLRIRTMRNGGRTLLTSLTLVQA